MADEEASRTLTQQSRDVDEDHLCKESDGISILEIFSVTYLGSSPVKPEDQVGSIIMKTNNTFYALYYEKKVDRSKPSIKYGDRLPIWPVEPICYFEKLKLKFDLFSPEYKGSKKLYAEGPEYGDRLAKLSLKSMDGYHNISVLFGCFPNATVANLNVVLVHDDIPSHAKSNVYGIVMATNSKFDHPACTSYLFSKNHACAVQLGHKGVLPLSKSRVGVPLNSELYVDISLFCDGSHYKGSASFAPKNDKNLCKVDDHIQVEVIWNCDDDDDSFFSDEDSSSTVEDPIVKDYHDLDGASECDSEDDTEIEILETDEL